MFILDKYFSQIPDYTSQKLGLSNFNEILHWIKFIDWLY